MRYLLSRNRCLCAIIPFLFGLILLFVFSTRTQAATFTFVAEADAYVYENSSQNYGAIPLLRTDIDGVSGNAFVSYLRFNVQNLDGPIDNATLRLFAMDTNSDVFTIYSVSDNTWDELAINATNKPALGNVIQTVGGGGQQ